MDKIDWLSENPNIKKVIDEAKKEGMKQGKNELIGKIVLMPKMKFDTKTKEEDVFIEYILTQVRNDILSHVFDITLKEMEVEVEGYIKKETANEKKCCECPHGVYEKCNRLCPISCPQYEKPCG